MKYSQLFGKTVKTVPGEITSASYKLLYKGGFIRQISAGRYAFLPLGFRVWEKIYRIIKEEMDAIGAQQIVTPTLHPIEFWQATNRDKAFGEEMLIVKDHHGATFAIGATAEGLMVELVKKFKPSYRDLPIVIYQFSDKFRDEKRPRGGLLRLREFMMKDAYSFAATEKESLAIYEQFYQAYLHIAEKFDLEAIPVLAHSGAIGGDYNHEFMVLSAAGEDTIFVCNQCDYAANRGKAESLFVDYPQEGKLRDYQEVEGKGIIGAQELASYLKIPLYQTTKTLLYNADNKLAAVCIRGDYDINEAKLAAQLGCSALQLATAEQIEKVTGAKVGYAGPLNLPKDIALIWDLTTKGRKNFETGANRTNYHSINVNFGRDVAEPAKFVDVRLVKEEELCVECKKGRLHSKRVIEFGHVFKQDHFYTGPMQGNFTDQDGKEKPLWMGAYGIGIGRAMAIIVETHHDKRGIIWPESVAPFQVHLIDIGNLQLEIRKKAEQIYHELTDQDIAILWDDRKDVSAGEKFADADLIGCPVRLVISAKTRDEVEYKIRVSDKPELVSLERLVNKIKRLK